jgi:RNA polymerase sigma-70 factor (ECF subfamily)
MEEWLLLAQRGDEAAVNRLVTTYQQPVFNLCYRMLGEYTEAEDAAQEALVKAVLNLHAYDVERPFKPWVLRIASNECIDRIRRRKPVVSLDGMGDDGAWEWQAGQSPNPETEMLHLERQVQIQEMLESLPPLDRTVITLFYWEGLSYTEIGDVTGLSISAIKSRLFRARRVMAQLIVGSNTMEEERYVA